MKLINLPNKILREKTEEVKEINKEIKDLVKEMRKIMKENNGVGLAANQIGKNISLFIAEPSEGKKSKFYVFINPKIIKLKGNEEIMEEGCLSIPGFWGYVKRYPEVTVEYLDLWGKKKKLKAKGLLAQIIQHEIDHLNGILFIDKAIEVFKIENKSRNFALDSSPEAHSPENA